MPIPSRAQEQAKRRGQATRENARLALGPRGGLVPRQMINRKVLEATRVAGGWRLRFECGHIITRDVGVGPSGRACCPPCGKAWPAKYHDQLVAAAKPPHIRDAETYCLCAVGADLAVGATCPGCGKVVG